MRTNLYLVIMAVSVALVSCNQPKDKKTQLSELRIEHSKLSAEIRRLEKEIQTENPEVAGNVKEVDVVEIKPSPFNYFVQTQGGIEAEENITVSAKIPGLVTRIFVQEGQTVSAGQVVAQIDNSLTLKGIEELKNNLELARTVYERQKNLWDQKIGTEIQFLTARNNKESLEKKLVTLQEQNDMSNIRSAINGTVDDVIVKVGENTAPGMPAVRVVNTKRLKVSGSISEAFVSSVNAGSKALVELADLGKSFEGKVSFVGKNINTLSRTFGFEVAVPSGIDARPGMSARIKIIFKTVPSALSVPVNVVQNFNNEKVVYVAEESEGKWVAHKRKVEVGGIYDNQAEITSGLNPGDRVISVGYQSLNEGELVKF